MTSEEALEIVDKVVTECRSHKSNGKHNCDECPFYFYDMEYFCAIELAVT